MLASDSSTTDHDFKGCTCVLLPWEPGKRLRAPGANLEGTCLSRRQTPWAFLTLWIRHYSKSHQWALSFSHLWLESDANTIFKNPPGNHENCGELNFTLNCPSFLLQTQLRVCKQTTSIRVWADAMSPNHKRKTRRLRITAFFLLTLEQLPGPSGIRRRLVVVVQSLSLSDCLQHARLLCPPPSPRVCSNSRPSRQWCHPTISSSVATFSSCPQFFPAYLPRYPDLTFQVPMQYWSL